MSTPDLQRKTPTLAPFFDPQKLPCSIINPFFLIPIKYHIQTPILYLLRERIFLIKLGLGDLFMKQLIKFVFPRVPQPSSSGTN